MYTLSFIYGDKKDPYIIKAVRGTDISARLPEDPEWEDDPETMRPEELGLQHEFDGWYPNDPESNKTEDAGGEAEP